MKYFHIKFEFFYIISIFVLYKIKSNKYDNKPYIIYKHLIIFI